MAFEHPRDQAPARATQRLASALAERRREVRIALHHPCALVTRDARLRGWIADISPGGLLVCLPFTVATYRLAPATGVEAEGIGWLAAKARWSCDHRLGMQFTEPARVRALVEALIAQGQR